MDLTTIAEYGLKILMEEGTKTIMEVRASANAECVEASEYERGDGCATDSTFFPATPCYEFEVSMVRI